MSKVVSTVRFELVGGELEHEGPIARHGREIENRRPQIAADADAAGAGRVQQVADKRCRRRLAVGCR